MTVGVNDVVRIVAEWDVPDGTIAQMVWHYIGLSGTPATEFQVVTAAENNLDFAWDQIKGNIDDTVLGSTIEAFVWDFVLHQWDGIGQVAMVGIDGEAINEMLPHGAAGLVKIFTAAQRRQARKYVMGFVETAQADGTLLPAAIVDLGLFAADLDDQLFPGSLIMNFGVFNTEPTSDLFETFSAAVGSVQAEGIFAYQRRRRPGTGI